MSQKKTIDNPPLNSELKSLYAAIGIPENLPRLQQIPFFEQADLRALEVTLLDYEGRPLILTTEAGAACRQMVQAANLDGIELSPFSGFRSYQYQATLVKRHLDRGRPLKELLTELSAPGFSEHHTGRAIDFFTSGHPPLNSSFENSQAFLWLTDNAKQFQFTMTYTKDNPYGFIYEPWHWTFQSDL